MNSTIEDIKISNELKEANGLNNREILQNTIRNKDSTIKNIESSNEYNKTEENLDQKYTKIMIEGEGQVSRVLFSILSH